MLAPNEITDRLARYASTGILLPVIFGEQWPSSDEYNDRGHATHPVTSSDQKHLTEATYDRIAQEFGEVQVIGPLQLRHW